MIVRMLSNRRRSRLCIGIMPHGERSNASPRNSDRVIRHNPAFGIATKIMRGQIGQSGNRRGLFHDGPDDLGSEAVSPSAPRLVDGSEQYPAG